MSEVFWGEHRVGERVFVGRPGTEDEATMVLLSSSVPDWVCIPAEAPHPDRGRRLRVAETIRTPCPAHRDPGTEHEVTTLILAGSELLVSMCPVAGWCVFSFSKDAQ